MVLLNEIFTEERVKRIRTTHTMFCSEYAEYHREVADWHKTSAILLIKEFRNVCEKIPKKYFPMNVVN